MIGGLLGILLGLNYIGIAWSGQPVQISFYAVLAILGIALVLFPRTIGMALTPVVFVTPVAFIIGWLKFGFSYGIQVGFIGVVAWTLTFVIGLLRRDAT